MKWSTCSCCSNTRKVSECGTNNTVAMTTKLFYLNNWTGYWKIVYNTSTGWYILDVHFSHDGIDTGYDDELYICCSHSLCNTFCHLYAQQYFAFSFSVKMLFSWYCIVFFIFHWMNHQIMEAHVWFRSLVIIAGDYFISASDEFAQGEKCTRLTPILAQFSALVASHRGGIQYLFTQPRSYKCSYFAT